MLFPATQMYRDCHGINTAPTYELPLIHTAKVQK